MPAEVEDKGTLGTLPFFYVISTRRTSSKGILCWVDGERADRLLMVCQRHHRFTRSQVP